MSAPTFLLLTWTRRNLFLQLQSLNLLFHCSLPFPSLAHLPRPRPSTRFWSAPNRLPHKLDLTAPRILLRLRIGGRIHSSLIQCSSPPPLQLLRAHERPELSLQYPSACLVQQQQQRQPARPKTRLQPSRAYQLRLSKLNHNQDTTKTISLLRAVAVSCHHSNLLVCFLVSVRSCLFPYTSEVLSRAKRYRQALKLTQDL